MASRSLVVRWAAGVGGAFKIGLIVALNTLVLFAVANVGASYYLEELKRAENLKRAAPKASGEEARREKARDVIGKYGIDLFKRLYPEKSERQIRELITDQPELPSAYEPFAEFRSTAIARPTLTIHQAGFRINGAAQGPWPLDGKALNIFVFGGSSTLGAGVEDDKTLPAALQSVLRERIGSEISVNVYNFAVGSHFSSQEVTYFQNQLRYGYLPDMVVFVDGPNDFHFWDGDPATAKNSRHVFDLLQSLSIQLGREQGVAWHLGELWRSLPVARLANKLGSKPADRLDDDPLDQSRQGDGVGWTKPRSDATYAEEDNEKLYSAQYSDSPYITDPLKIQTVIKRYLMNRDIAQGVSRQLGIEAIFAWQPVPLYKYNLALHPFRIQDEHRRVHYGYPAMARYLQTHDMGANFAWCADIQRNVDHPLYVKELYHSAEGNRMIADCIADTVMASGVIDRIRNRKLDPATTVAARNEIPTADEAMASVVEKVFGPQALTGNMAMSSPLGEWGDKLSTGIQLEDASADYAVIYQYFPLEQAPADRTYQFSVRVKPVSSNYVGLVMVCVGGAKPEDAVLFVNPETMAVIAASGNREVRDEPGGWTRLTLTGTCKEPGNDRLQVMFYPAHGAPENRGAILFGGGEVRRVVASQRQSDQGSRQ